jgi:DNA-binding NarL/FixJ family response regulator
MAERMFSNPEGSSEVGGTKKMEFRRRILIVEDDALLASLLNSVLDTLQFDVRISSDALAARSDCLEFDPDLCLIDINLGEGPNGIHFAEWLNINSPTCRKVFLTSSTDLRSWVDRKTLSAPWVENTVFLSKGKLSDTNNLIESIDRAFSSDSYQLPDTAPSKFRELTKAQVDVLFLAAEGFTNEAIAIRRKSTKRTIEQQLQACYRTLGVAEGSDFNQRVIAVRMFLSAKGSNV